MRIRICFAIALVLGLAVHAAPAWSASGANFSVEPASGSKVDADTRSYFVFDGVSSGRVTGRVRVTNTGKGPGTAILFAVDATTGATSGAVYRAASDPREGVGAWLRLGSTQLRLGPGESAVVPFSLTLPDGTAAGDHLGGIVVKDANGDQTTKAGALRVKVEHLAVVAVLVRTPGAAVPKIDLSQATAEISGGYQRVFLRMTNSGNVLVKPEGTMILRDGDGQTVLQKEFSLDTFVPGSTIDYPIVLPKALATGAYEADVTLSTGTAFGNAGEPVETTATLPFEVKDEVKPTQNYTAPPKLDTADIEEAQSGSGGGFHFPWTYLLFPVGLLVAVFAIAVARSRVRARRDFDLSEPLRRLGWVEDGYEPLPTRYDRTETPAGRPAGTSSTDPRRR